MPSESAYRYEVSLVIVQFSLVYQKQHPRIQGNADCDIPVSPGSRGFKIPVNVVLVARF